MAAYTRTCEIFADPAVAAEIAADEEHFLDRNSMLHFLVDERCSKT